MQLVLDVRNAEESLQCVRTLLLALSPHPSRHRLPIICVAALRSVDSNDQYESLRNAVQNEARSFGFTDPNVLFWLPVLFSEADDSIQNPSPTLSSSLGCNEQTDSTFSGPMSVVAPGKSGGRFWMMNWRGSVGGYSKTAASSASSAPAMSVAGLVPMRDLRARLEHLLRAHVSDSERVPDMYHRFGGALERLALPSPPVIDRAHLKRRLQDEGVALEASHINDDDEFLTLIRFLTIRSHSN